MKTRLAIHTVDGSIVWTKATEEMFANKDAIEQALRQYHKADNFNAVVDGHTRHFNVNNIVSIWTEDME